ncbi:hypothetical protein ACIHCQ_43175 [Streptomyces sp. NPDC052236]|uniref:hypothetical protein n=1 Tax=Streptomyces sp. NPDC052236 TaxID=3365686 RepID=UPI0037D2CB61
MFERADATLRQLTRYWETFRQKDDPKTSPAIDALNEVWLPRGTPASTWGPSGNAAGLNAKE